MKQAACWLATPHVMINGSELIKTNSGQLMPTMCFFVILTNKLPYLESRGRGRRQG